MPTHEITFKTTKIPAELPKGATVTEVSRFPLVFERRGNELELFLVPANEATKASGVVAAIHVNGSHVELTTDTARNLARELIGFADSRDALVVREKREDEQKAVQEQARRAHVHLERMLYNYGAPRRRSPIFS